MIHIDMVKGTDGVWRTPLAEKQRLYNLHNQTKTTSQRKTTPKNARKVVGKTTRKPVRKSTRKTRKIARKPWISTRVKLMTVSFVTGVYPTLLALEWLFIG